MNTRVCFVRCPHWAVTSLHRRDPSLRGVPVVIHSRVGARDLVRDASEEARADGVEIGMRWREAQAHCGEAIAFEADPIAEARTFEPVARALEAVTARIELDTPGCVGFPTLGPSRYFGGDDALATTVRAAVRGLLGADAPVRVGIADGHFTARLAARTDAVVAPGGAAEFLAPYPVGCLGDAALVGLLERLGLTTLGAFAALPEHAVLERFGVDGARRHAWARGLDVSTMALDDPPPELVVTMELDPPVSQVDAAAFAAKALADQLVSELAGRGLACTRVVVEAQTEHGETLSRCWRHEDGFRPGVLAERVRWQLDGWLAAQAVVVPLGDLRAQQDADVFADGGLDSTTGALTLLRLVPDEVVPIPARQLAFFGGDAAAAARADRALSRVQGLLGFDAVGTLVEQGGRTPGERIRFVPWGEPREPLRPLRVGSEVAAWPGAVPAPAPARVFDPPRPAELLDAAGAPVRVGGRGEASAPPARVGCDALVGGGGPVRAWAGPWPNDVRWWDPTARRRGVRWQVVASTDAGDVACLVLVEGSRASLEAIYD
jgi:protein ImuB